MLKGMSVHHRTPFIFYNSYSAYVLGMGQWEENRKARGNPQGDDANLCTESNPSSGSIPEPWSYEAGILPTVAYYSILCYKWVHIYFADCGTASMVTGKALYSIYIFPSLHYCVNHQTWKNMYHMKSMYHTYSQRGPSLWGRGWRQCRWGRRPGLCLHCSALWWARSNVLHACIE